MRYRNSIGGVLLEEAAVELSAAAAEGGASGYSPAFSAAGAIVPGTAVAEQAAAKAIESDLVDACRRVEDRFLNCDLAMAERTRSSDQPEGSTRCWRPAVTIVHLRLPRIRLTAPGR